jgi:hypothetical protein
MSLDGYLLLVCGAVVVAVCCFMVLVFGLVEDER